MVFEKDSTNIHRSDEEPLVQSAIPQVQPPQQMPQVQPPYQEQQQQFIINQQPQLHSENWAQLKVCGDPASQCYVQNCVYAGTHVCSWHNNFPKIFFCARRQGGCRRNFCHYHRNSEECNRRFDHECMQLAVQGFALPFIDHQRPMACIECLERRQRDSKREGTYKKLTLCLIIGSLIACFIIVCIVANAWTMNGF